MLVALLESYSRAGVSLGHRRSRYSNASLHAVPPVPTSLGPSLQGTYGPFTPNMPVDVPLWLALALQRRRKCRILPPEWMNADVLQCAPDPGMGGWVASQRISMAPTLAFRMSSAKICVSDDYLFRAHTHAIGWNASIMVMPSCWLSFRA
jgi:hypothetical protein